jgi:hypothetical protein
MKEKMPESHDIMIQCFTDPAEWDAAHWDATVFLSDPTCQNRHPPGIGLGFRNFDAGKKIFDGWIQRVGHVDLYEELRISIIEGPIPSDPEGYTVFISSNPLRTIHRKQIVDPSFNPARFLRISRLSRMYPEPGSPHLRLFKKHFAARRRFQIFPAELIGSRIKSVDLSRSIEKSELHLLLASDLKPDQPEYAVLTAKNEQSKRAA